MDSREISEWVAFNRIEPIGQDWLQAGVIAASVVNASGFVKGKARQPEDFMPIVRRPKAQTAAEGKARMAMFAAAFQAQKQKRV